MKVKEESDKARLNLSIQKTKSMASSPITSWQIEGAKVEAVTDFIFLGSKITVDCDCSHEIKTLGRKAVRQRCCFVSKGLSRQSYGFSSSNVRILELDHMEG